MKRSAHMSASVSCRVEQPSTANPDAVYDVLMDCDRWPEWFPAVSAAWWEGKGAPETGIGGIRRVRVGFTLTHERIVEGTRPGHHAYVVKLPWFVPLKDYKGDVRIEDRPNGSHIVWTASCTLPFPGFRKSNQSALKAAYVRNAAPLAQEAERTATR